MPIKKSPQSISMQSLWLAKKAAGTQNYWQINKGVIQSRRIKTLSKPSIKIELANISWLISACSRLAFRSKRSLNWLKRASSRFKEERVWCRRLAPSIRAEGILIPWQAGRSFHSPLRHLGIPHEVCSIPMKPDWAPIEEETKRMTKWESQASMLGYSIKIRTGINRRKTARLPGRPSKKAGNNLNKLMMKRSSWLWASYRQRLCIPRMHLRHMQVLSWWRAMEVGSRIWSRGRCSSSARRTSQCLWYHHRVFLETAWSRNL